MRSKFSHQTSSSQKIQFQMIQLTALQPSNSKFEKINRNTKRQKEPKKIRFIRNDTKKSVEKFLV